jgi:hypothetical protein
MQNGFIESFNGRLRDEHLNEILFSKLAQPGHRLLLGGQIITACARTQNSPGRHPQPSPLNSNRAGIWRCATPRAPHQLPPLPQPMRLSPTARTNSEMDKIWGKVIFDELMDEI